MRARIHRGAREIGGSCVELDAGGQRVLLDAGLPLDRDAATEAQLPHVAESGDASLLGVVVSHSHPDHVGLVERLAPSVPTFMGEAASRMLGAASFYTRQQPPRISGYLKDLEAFELGPFRITPYLIDHSGYDAYALLVEADDSRLFYTGDVRAHGRKPWTFTRLLNNPPVDIDALLLEGTSVGRPSASGFDSESELEQHCARRFSDTEGAALACYSPQNVDRLVTVYRAALQAGRSLVLDLYSAEVAAATGNERIPQAEWDRLRVYVPNSQRIRVKESREFWRVNKHRRERIFVEELASDPSSWVITFRASMAPELARGDCLEGAQAFWMMWRGYLDQPGDNTRRKFEDLGVGLEVTHASGHAPVEDLQRLAVAFSADRVVPIQTASPESFPSLFDNVHHYADGEWWDV